MQEQCEGADEGWNQSWSASGGDRTAEAQATRARLDADLDTSTQPVADLVSANQLTKHTWICIPSAIWLIDRGLRLFALSGISGKENTLQYRANVSHSSADFVRNGDNIA